MSFQVRIHRAASRRIAQWNLPDAVLVDVYLNLDKLHENPAQFLLRNRAPYDGLTYPFFVHDNSNRDFRYLFVFHVKYDVTEETIWVKKGGYVRFASKDGS